MVKYKYEEFSIFIVITLLDNFIVIYMFCKMHHNNNVFVLTVFCCVLLQTQVIASTAAGVAAEGLSPMDSKAEAENAVQLSVALVENAIVVLMLVEDHLRLQSKLYSSSRFSDSTATPVASSNSEGSALSRASSTKEPLEALSSQRSLSRDSGGLPIDVCSLPLNICLYKTLNDFFIF